MFRHGAVIGVASRDNDGAWTQALGDDGGLGGVASKLACFVGRGGDDSAWAVASDEDGFALECGVVALFYGREEGVHVDVQDGAGLGHGVI